MLVASWDGWSPERSAVLATGPVPANWRTGELGEVVVNSWGRAVWDSHVVGL